jgi:hypothetical protein
MGVQKQPAAEYPNSSHALLLAIQKVSPSIHCPEILQLAASARGLPMGWTNNLGKG